MLVDIHKNELLSVKRRFNASAKSVHLRHPAQSTQAALARNLSLLVNFLYIKEPHYLIIQFVFETKINMK